MKCTLSGTPIPFGLRPAPVERLGFGGKSQTRSPEARLPSQSRSRGFPIPTGKCRSVRRTSSVTHRSGGRLVPVEVGPDVCAAPSAGRAGEARLDVRQPYVIWPAIGAKGDGMAATTVDAIDQDAAPAPLAHGAEGDLLRPHGLGP